MFDALQTLADNGLTIDTQNIVLAEMIEGDNFEHDADKRCAIALLWYRENEGKCCLSDCKPLWEETVEVGGNDYMVLTNDEADTAFDAYLEGMLDDKGVVPGANEPYFDRKAWKRDASINGRGGLSGWDGEEQEYCADDGEWYYLYRMT